MNLTLRVRVKDKHAALLNRMARDVSFVWNYANELTYRRWRESRVWMSGYDAEKYVAGATLDGDMVVPADTIACVVKEHARKRQQYRKTKLCWRSRYRSLGWVPFRRAQAQWKDGAVVFYGHRFDVWDSYGLNAYEFRCGSFSQDARGRWYFNVVVEVAEQPCTALGDVGVDLGLKRTATYSDGATFEPGQFYRELEPKLAIAQRARKKKRAKAIHAKIANRRKDALHKESTCLVRENEFIAVGDVSSSQLAKTRMAKSVFDAGWYMFREMLRYKAIRHSADFAVVNEAFTTRTCSSCGSLSGPKGVNGLRIREWTCHACGETHDRDVNAARNILALGSERPVGGTPKKGRGQKVEEALVTAGVARLGEGT